MTLNPNIQFPIPIRYSRRSGSIPRRSRSPYYFQESRVLIPSLIGSDYPTTSADPIDLSIRHGPTILRAKISSPRGNPMIPSHCTGRNHNSGYMDFWFSETNHTSDLGGCGFARTYIQSILNEKLGSIYPPTHPERKLWSRA